jgi:predicted nuclease with TOPRIM domain
VKERTEIEGNAKNLSEKLEVVQAEKQMLESEYNHNQNTIDRYNHEISELKSELENMKHVISNTFEEEL